MTPHSMKDTDGILATIRQGSNPDNLPWSREMNRDEIFRTGVDRASNFEFNADVAQVFDDMLVRSIPLYCEQQCMIRDMAAKFWIPGTNIYDLGCSTGTTLLNIAPVIPGPCRLIGLDNSLPCWGRRG